MANVFTKRGPGPWGGGTGGGGGGGGAPTDAEYIVGAAHGGLSNERLLGAVILPPDVIANIPAANSVPAGALFFATDEEQTYRSTGVAWEEYSGTGGGTAVGIVLVTGDRDLDPSDIGKILVSDGLGPWVVDAAIDLTGFDPGPFWAYDLSIITNFGLMYPSTGFVPPYILAGVDLASLACYPVALPGQVDDGTTTTQISVSPNSGLNVTSDDGTLSGSFGVTKSNVTFDVEDTGGGTTLTYQASNAGTLLVTGADAGSGWLGVENLTPTSISLLVTDLTDLISLVLDDAGTITLTSTIGGDTSTTIFSPTGTSFSDDITVPDEAYGAGWDSSLEVPTKNALYDIIETLATTTFVQGELAGYVLKSLYDANTILAANSDNTPAALTVGEQTLVGRITGGNIAALTPSQIRTLLDVPTNAEAVLDTLYDAHTILAATTDNTPAALTVGEQTLVGRITGGNIAALTPSQIRTLLDVPTNAEAVLDTLFDANTILAANSDNTPAAVTIAEQRIVGRITGGNIAALTGAEVAAVAAGEVFKQAQETNAQTGTSYTLVAGDVGKLVTLSNGSAITLTLPQDSDATIAVGCYVDMYQLGAGQVTVQAGSGATLRTSGLTAKARAQYSRFSVQKVSANTWSLFGDLAAS